jgi:hypothetical protein
MTKQLTQSDVIRQSRALARRAFQGDRKSVAGKASHVIAAAEQIYFRWQISPHKWQVKHVRWFLEIYLSDKSSGTRYRYFRYIRAVLVEINRWVDFKAFLTGPWMKP